MLRSHGKSQQTGPGGACDASDPAAHDGLPCCVADAGSRYLSFARALGENAREDSICSTRFKDTMLGAAAFFGSSRVVDLVEPPKDGLVVVEESHDESAWDTVARLDAAACESSTGWYLEGDRRIVFCGDAVPGPGDSVRIRAKGQAATCVDAP
jgi:hypothetical protein